MTVSHRAAAAPASSEVMKPEKVARMACCCKLSDLLPVVQQLHQEAIRAHAAKAGQQSEAA